LTIYFLSDSELFLKEHCVSFGWDTVRFLHTSWYGAVFRICAGNSVDDNTVVF